MSPRAVKSPKWNWSSALRIYAGHPFVRLRSTSPEIKQVRGSNYCDIYPVYDERTNRILVFSAIDNLVKGAASVSGWNYTMARHSL